MKFSSLKSKEAHFIGFLRSDKKFNALIKKFLENYEYSKPSEIKVDFLLNSFVDDLDEEDVMPAQ